MQKRKFGKHELEMPILGFGIMRMPTVSPDSREVDEAKSLEMIRCAIDNGVTFIDTAYNYHGGKSELFVGKALQDGYREKVTLSTKMPLWMVKSAEDFDRLLNEHLQKLQTEHIDVYLLHGLNKGSWKQASELGVLDFLSRAKADGRIKLAGFSFHDELPVFKQIVDTYDWDCTLIQLNYMDEYNQAGLEGLRYAAAKGLGIMIMEPLLGGRLANDQPPEVQDIWAKASIKRTPAEWGLRWVWNLREVTTVLSGMSNMEQLQENISIAKTALPESLTPEELSLIDQVKDFYRARTRVNCTKCMYCMPCPVHVQIPLIFDWYNQATMYDLPQKQTSGMYGHMIERKGDASNCTDCGKCETVCPQAISIREVLREFHAKYAPAKEETA